MHTLHAEGGYQQYGGGFPPQLLFEKDTADPKGKVAYQKPYNPVVQFNYIYRWYGRFQQKQVRKAAKEIYDPAYDKKPWKTLSPKEPYAFRVLHLMKSKSIGRSQEKKLTPMNAKLPIISDILF